MNKHVGSKDPFKKIIMETFKRLFNGNKITLVRLVGIDTYEADVLKGGTRTGYQNLGRFRAFVPPEGQAISFGLVSTARRQSAPSKMKAR